MSSGEGLRRAVGKGNEKCAGKERYETWMVGEFEVRHLVSFRYTLQSFSISSKGYCYDNETFPGFTNLNPKFLRVISPTKRSTSEASFEDAAPAT